MNKYFATALMILALCLPLLPACSSDGGGGGGDAASSAGYSVMDIAGTWSTYPLDGPDKTYFAALTFNDSGTLTGVNMSEAQVTDYQGNVNVQGDSFTGQVRVQFRIIEGPHASSTTTITKSFNGVFLSTTQIKVDDPASGEITLSKQ